MRTLFALRYNDNPNAPEFEIEARAMDPERPVIVRPLTLVEAGVLMETIRATFKAILTEQTKVA